MAWEPIATLPQDDHHRLFTRSVANAGDRVDELPSEGLVQAVGAIGDDGAFVLQQQITGDPGEGWEPTHWFSEGETKQEGVSR